MIARRGGQRVVRRHANPRCRERVHMDFTRRTLLKGGLGAAGLAVFGGLAPRVAAAPRTSGAGTTLERTILKSTSAGYAPLSLGPGEPYLVRQELATRTSPQPGTGRVIASFAQLTDIHIVDTQSPARFEFLDQYGLPAIRPFLPPGTDLASAYRPDELLTAQVAEPAS
jgi:hypothetical protein